MRAYADQNNQRTYGDLEWVEFSQGYWEFRRFIVGQASEVDLFLTGKMRQDMIIRWHLTSISGDVLATVGPGVSRVQGSTIAVLSLEIGWETVSSERVAWYIEHGQFPRLFAFWTEQEQDEILRMFADYISRYDKLHEGNTGGRFQPVGF